MARGDEQLARQNQAYADAIRGYRAPPVVDQAKVEQAAKEAKEAAYRVQAYKQAQDFKAQRNQDIAEGAKMGEKYFGNQALGRVNENRSADIQSILNQRKAQSAGYTPEELQVMRSQNMGQILQNQAAASRDLARQQARSGVRGAIASNQQSSLQNQNQGVLANQEQQLFLNNIAAKRQGLNDYQSGVQGAEANELARRQYNLGNQGQELAGKLSTTFGLANLGTQERAAAMQSILGTKAADAYQKIADGQDTSMCCFIFLEARYGNGTMDSVVRRFRDENMTDRNRRGYYKLSQVLVPFMRKSRVVKWIVRATMTTPLVAYGKYHYGQSRLGGIFAPLKRFWLGVFDYLGDDHAFIRENGEIV